jgi:hypothetical protein
MIQARAGILCTRGYIDARADGAHGVLEVEIEPVTQRAAKDVVLFGGNPRLSAVWRDHSRAEIVRYPATLVLEVRCIAVCEHDRACHRHGARQDLYDFAARAPGIDDRRALARQQRRDEPRNVDVCSVRCDRYMPRIGADRKRRNRCTRRRIELQELASAFQRHERESPRGRKSDAERLRRARQGDGLSDCERARIEDRDG